MVDLFKLKIKIKILIKIKIKWKFITKKNSKKFKKRIYF